MDDFVYQQPQRFRITNKQRDEERKRKSGSSGGIPDRWLDYLGVNTHIENTRFIAFKCPLKPDMQKHLPDERRFTLGDLVEKLDDKGKEIGLIIDLTNTDRYYKATDIADAQMQYHKMMTPGHNQIPNEACYQQFADFVRIFLEQNKHNEKLIGVHCTHGLNRTGYLIVRYMIEQMGFEANEALEAFNRARGHSMEKYTEDLLRRKPLSTSMSSSTTHQDAGQSSDQDAEQLQWPNLYSTMESISLSEPRRQQSMPSMIRTPSNEKEWVPQTRSGYNASKSHDQERSVPRSANGPFYRQTSVTPRVLHSSVTEDKHSIQSSSTFFGSGSNVGRGRPMTGDR